MMMMISKPNVGTRSRRSSINRCTDTSVASNMLHHHNSTFRFVQSLQSLVIVCITFVILSLIVVPVTNVTATITIIDTQQMYPNSFIDYKQYNTRPFRTNNDYYSRLQSMIVHYDTNNKKDEYGICNYNTNTLNKKDYNVIVPNDGLPITLLLVINVTSTTSSSSTSQAEEQDVTSPLRSLSRSSSSSSSSSCTIEDQIQYTIHHVLPLNRVRYLIIAVSEDVEDNEYGKRSIRSRKMNDIEQEPTHYSDINSTNESDTTSVDDNDIPLYVVQVTMATQQDLLFALQHSISNDTIMNGGPQIAMNTNHYDGHSSKKKKRHHSSDSGENSQTLIYTTLIAFIISASCCILLLLSSSDWDDDAILHNTNAAAQQAAANRTTRQKLTKEQVRQLLPLYRYNANTNQLIRVGSNSNKRSVLLSSTSADATISTTTATTDTSSSTMEVDTLRQPLLTVSQQSESQVIDEKNHSVVPPAPDVINDIDLQNSECSICLDEFVHGDIIRILYNYCSHTYHAKCIGRWLSERSAVCPLCKYNLYIDEEEEEDDEYNINEENNRSPPNNITQATSNNNRITSTTTTNAMNHIWHHFNNLFVVSSVPSLDNNTLNDGNMIENITSTNNSTEGTVTPPEEQLQQQQIVANENDAIDSSYGRGWTQRIFSTLSWLPQNRRQSQQQSQSEQTEVDASGLLNTGARSSIREPLLPASTSDTDAANDVDNISNDGVDIEASVIS